MPINESKLNELLAQMVNDMGAAAVAPLVTIGDRLGLYRALAKAGPMSAQELAQATQTTARYVTEWCAAQTGSGYIELDPETGNFSMTPEQQAVFADDTSPAYMTGGYYSLASLFLDEPKVEHAFRTGEGIGWGEHNECLFCGTEKFFRTGYEANLVEVWLPALQGVCEKLEAGAKVADIGCGYGASTIVMAKAYPKSEFIGYDFHEPSIDAANQRAKEHGLSNIRFETATAKYFKEKDFDLIAYFDCLHDMGDPVGGMQHTLEALKPDGTLMIVEPFANDKLVDNLNPVARMYYAFSTMICVPASISQEVGLALGAQAGPKRIEEVIREGGFTKFKVATANPFNMILEAKP